MAAPSSHIRFSFFFEADHHNNLAAHRYCNGVEFSVFDHRRSTDFSQSLRFPCPRSHSSPHLYYRSLETWSMELCTRFLQLPPCCISTLVPQLVNVIMGPNCFHRCPGHIPIKLHILDAGSDHHSESAVLRESFEAAEPKATPASLESISELVEQKMKMGDSDQGWSCGSTCTICFDEIETPKTALKMPCSHLFHQDCILQWLSSSHVCPLCRYQMPVSTASEHSSSESV